MSELHGRADKAFTFLAATQSKEKKLVTAYCSKKRKFGSQKYVHHKPQLMAIAANA